MRNEGHGLEVRGEGARERGSPGALGVLNPCARGPMHLHAGYSTALAWSAGMEDWWLGQAGVGLGVMVAEAAAALGEGQSGRKQSVRVPLLAPACPLAAGPPMYNHTCSELQPLLRLPPGLRPSSPEGPESAAGGIGCTTGGSAARFTGGPPRLAP